MDGQNASSSLRSPLSSICTLLVVGLLVGASLSAVQPGIRDLHRDTAVQREAVRHLSVSVARVVRHLRGDHTRPALQAASRSASESRDRVIASASPCAREGPAVAPVRVELLDLPPPAPSAAA